MAFFIPGMMDPMSMAVALGYHNEAETDGQMAKVQLDAHMISDRYQQ